MLAHNHLLGNNQLVFRNQPIKLHYNKTNGINQFNQQFVQESCAVVAALVLTHIGAFAQYAGAKI
jgi:hypothetical protein